MKATEKESLRRLRHLAGRWNLLDHGIDVLPLPVRAWNSFRQYELGNASLRQALYSPNAKEIFKSRIFLKQIRLALKEAAGK